MGFIELGKFDTNVNNSFLGSKKNLPELHKRSWSMSWRAGIIVLKVTIGNTLTHSGLKS